MVSDYKLNDYSLSQIHWVKTLCEPFIEVHNHLRNIKTLAAQGQPVFLIELQASSSNCRVNDTIIISVLFLWSKCFIVIGAVRCTEHVRHS